MTNNNDNSIHDDVGDQTGHEATAQNGPAKVVGVVV
jgi:hypothetical protein